jgi:hypothetical protein
MKKEAIDTMMHHSDIYKTLPTWEAILLHWVAIQLHQPSKNIQAIHLYEQSLK